MMTNDPNRLEELSRRQQKAKALGGIDKINKQHSLQKLTARERIERLLDKDSFYEIGELAVSDVKEARSKTPADGKVCGYGTIDKRRVGISADDATVLAGSGGRIGYEKEFKTHLYAQKQGFPSIHLGDGGGARIPDIMGATGMMTFTYDIMHEPRNRQTPLITAIMGECYGGPTWKASVSDIVVQVKGAVMAVSGPNVLETATSEKVSPEALGGFEMHARKTGLTDIWAENDADALRQIRRVLTYLPSNANELPPITEAKVFSGLKSDALLKIIPQDDRYSYDMHRLLEQVFDQDSLLELKSYYDGSLITALARLDGRVVGVLANNPKVSAGAMGFGACDKAVSFITLCDSYHIPLVFMHDTPGFYVSQRAEEMKMPIKIMTFIQALHQSTVPKIGVIVRKSYGMAHCNMLGARMGADFMLAWPKAEIGFMAPNVALNVMFGRKMQEVSNPDELKQAFLAEINRQNEPWEAAERFLIDKIIDPRDARQELITALKIATHRNGGKSQRHLANWPRV